jgi:transcriptional regulator with XRE-family HTH domain
MRKTPIVAPLGAKGFELAVGAKVDPKSIGAELRRLREIAGVSASDLAERMGWKAQNVSRLERGGDKREPTLSSLNLYVRRLGYELVLTARPKRSPVKRPAAATSPAAPAESDAAPER